MSVIEAPPLTAARIRARLRTEPKVAKVWKPPAITDFASDTEVLGFDAALMHTGWIKIVRSGNAILVPQHATINLATSEKGFLATWHLADQLDEQVSQVLHKYHNLSTWTAVEAPPVGGGHRTESSLIAGMVIWNQRLVMRARRRAIAANHISSVLCGNPRHDKREVAAAVKRYIPGCTGRTWSEHQRDAAAVALTLLWGLSHPGGFDAP